MTQAKSKFTHESDFRRERDFGAKIGATFEFVAAQFKPLLKCLLCFVLPGALLAGIGMGLIMGKMLDMMPNLPGRRSTLGEPVEVAQSYNSNPFANASTVLGVGLTALGVLAAVILLSSTVYAFVRVRMATPPEERVEPGRVWAALWPRLGRVLGAFLLLGFLLTVGFGVVGGALSLIGPGFVVLLMPLLLWLMVCLSLYFPVLWMEDGGLLAALRRCFYLIKGKWWSTFGLYMIITFITGVINYLFIIPFYALMISKMLLHWQFDTEILSLAAMSFYALGWVFTAVLPLVAMLFQYFNLVERREGVGLRHLIGTLGQSAAPQVSSAAYRPDEEGEY
ncbi:hypothetical protein ACFST9_23405 [Hymenobacter monticola]|uniref:Glycerophosphoryl diester phosphodiesterase membrane domain-containing protein n=1 Tax=Hymenobacter monticola TaxID=1705399 RepID=A0ABY4B487_9BACT|nr:hypothetical protein [Hymenobacter monticola]UOE33952.1 hypothetical protein MTP16_22915 [Hymenobacter monticola]